jgi:Holliday junction DNA helicase RuvA
MINFLQGIVTEIESQAITISLGGIGFNVCVAKPSMFNLQQPVTLSIHLHWNQEQGPQLFGFLSPADKILFVTLTTVPGLGPKIALSILSTLSCEQTVQAITTSHIKILSSVSGIGTKKAETIILHLKDKILKNPSLAQACSGMAPDHFRKIGEALQGLGYSRLETQQAMDSVNAQRTTEQSFDELFRKALMFLSKSKLNY